MSKSMRAVIPSGARDLLDECSTAQQMPRCARDDKQGGAITPSRFKRGCRRAACAAAATTSCSSRYASWSAAASSFEIHTSCHPERPEGTVCQTISCTLGSPQADSASARARSPKLSFRRKPESSLLRTPENWIPAFAGKTCREFPEKSACRRHETLPAAHARQVDDASFWHHASRASAFGTPRAQGVCACTRRSGNPGGANCGGTTRSGGSGIARPCAS